MLKCKDKNGNVFQIETDDPRYINGEVIGITGTWIIIDNIKYSKKEVMRLFNISIYKLEKLIKSNTTNWIYSKV